MVASRRDHPRACGEDDHPTRQLFPREGPPPRMRGRLERQPCTPVRGRTTPAHAGKTTPTRGCGRGCSDHPRACGEDVVFPGLGDVCLGPPPRMRGRPRRQTQSIRSLGTTPAHAGKTSLSLMLWGIVRDHPRACGEDNDMQAVRAAATGPPPRMRGRLLDGDELTH